MELKGKTINFLGDSITQGAGTSCNEAIYHSLIKEKYGLKEARNYGIGGTRIARQTEITSLVRDKDFILRAGTMEPADVVVVFGGTNDFGNGQAPVGTFEDRDKRTFYGALHTLVQDLIKDYYDKTIVFITPLHRYNEDSCIGTWKPDGVEQRPLKDYVQAVRDVCEYYSVPLLDLFASGELCGNTPEWYLKYMPDGLHPNDEGHKILANKLGKFLENL